MFENRALRKIFGTKREGVTGDLHNEEVRDLVCNLTAHIYA
jgi:hypothetical protein